MTPAQHRQLIELVSAQAAQYRQLNELSACRLCVRAGAQKGFKSVFRVLVLLTDKCY